MLQKKSSNGSLEDVSIISKGVNIEGKFKSEGSVRIDGIVNGDVFVEGNLTLGETAEIKGEVKAENITLSGKIFGQVSATDKLVMESKSILKGDLSAKILVIEPGAFFEGKCLMSPAEKEE
ncbi:MAG: bactofilin family protein [Bacillota bacterium]